MEAEDSDVLTLKLKDLNSVLTCRLCNGYIIEATTITECLHTFCRSCILNYIDEDYRGGTSNVNAGPDKGVRCPTCDTVIHESQPKQHIATDSTVDEIVMKVVPGLRDRELQREEEFYRRKNLKWPKADMIAAQKEAEAKKRKLESGVSNLSNGLRNGTVNGTSPSDAKDDGNSTVDELEEDPEDESGAHKNYHRDDMQIRFILEPAVDEKVFGPLPHKYVLCSEHTPVSAIKKVVCKQLGLTSPSQVDLTCSDSKLGRDHSMKFVFITRWRGRKEHLLINYRSTANLL